MKDQLPKLMKSYVVHQFNCPGWKYRLVGLIKNTVFAFQNLCIYFTGELQEEVGPAHPLLPIYILIKQ